MNAVTRIDRRFYPSYTRNWDDAMLRRRILKQLTPETDLLDVGAGAGIVEAMNFKGLARHICGVDLDPRVVNNPFLDEGRVADAGRIPYPDNSFDLAFADNVMEHLDNPVEVFAEIARVLRPGGLLIFKTPNRTHYVPLIARLTPHGFHRWINKRRGREEEDTFPTLYRANSPRQVRDLSGRTGFAVERVDLIEGRPEYMRFSAPTYLLGLAFERLVNTTDALSSLRILLIAELRKLAR